MVFNKNWFISNQRLLRWFANTSYGKDILGHGLDRVDLILPNAVFQHLEDNKVKAEFRTHDKYGKRLFYEYKPIWKAFHWFDQNIANTYVPKFNLGFDTLGPVYPAAGTNEPVDAQTRRTGVNEPFSTIRNGDGNSVNNTATNSNHLQISGAATSNQYSTMVRGHFCFDTSALSAGAIIESATYSAYGINKTDDMGSIDYHLAASGIANTSEAVASDYQTVSRTSFGSVVFASWSTSGYNDILLNASGLANINKTGISKFSCQSQWDINNSTSGLSWANNFTSSLQAYWADQTGISNDPKLVVTYTLPSGAIFFGTNI